MSVQANIRDIQILGDLKTAFGRFGEDVLQVLAALEKQFEEIQEWLEERQNHWRRQADEAEDQVHATRRALRDCENSGSDDDEGDAPDCGWAEEGVNDAEKHLAECEEKLETVKQWRHRIEGQIADFQGDMHRLSNLASSRTSSVQSFLANKIEILDRYVGGSPAGVGISGLRDADANAKMKPSSDEKSQQVKTPLSAERKNPVSKALQLEVDGLLCTQINDALRAIDEVHDDGILPKIPLRESNMESNAGYFFRNPSTGFAGHIGVRRTGPWPELTTVHEVGHFLDFEAIGLKGKFASQSNAPIIQNVMETLNRTNAVQNFQRRLEKSTPPDETETFLYLLNPKEMWARAYAQFIAERSSNTMLKSQVEKSSVQWTKEDFAPVAEAIEKMFKKLNWL